MTDPVPGRRSAPRRKRPHPAAASRVLVAGAAAAGTLAMTGLMTRPPDQTVSVEPTSAGDAALATLATSSEQPTGAPAARIVIVRRHHPAPSSGSAVTSSAAAASTASVSRAPAPRPAPRPAPVTSKSGGS